MKIALSFVLFGYIKFANQRKGQQSKVIFNEQINVNQNSQLVLIEWQVKLDHIIEENKYCIKMGKEERRNYRCRMCMHDFQKDAVFLDGVIIGVIKQPNGGYRRRCMWGSPPPQLSLRLYTTCELRVRPFHWPINDFRDSTCIAFTRHRKASLAYKIDAEFFVLLSVSWAWL